MGFNTKTQIFSIVPMSSCFYERAFSKLIHVKTKLRSTIKHDRFKLLILLCIKQKLMVNVVVSKVIDKF